MKICISASAKVSLNNKNLISVRFHWNVTAGACQIIFLFSEYMNFDVTMPSPYILEG